MKVRVLAKRTLCHDHYILHLASEDEALPLEIVGVSRQLYGPGIWRNDGSKLPMEDWHTWVVDLVPDGADWAKSQDWTILAHHIDDRADQATGDQPEGKPSEGR